ncbi:tetratricopeptide repeat protein [Reinekea forsetii]|uniref:tetratricopeptide repeat protein n=1 Tax=Reinekea forsetii TaxID=1336806 RepID=UPI002357F1AA|nr:tetratricopeptide repeat protein [Reinekea forsetii]
MRKLSITTLVALYVLSFMIACSDNTQVEKAASFLDRSVRYEQQGQFRAALIEIRNALQADPSDPLLTVHYARLLTRIGSPNQAEALFKNQSDSIDAIRLAYAEVLLLQGKTISAQELLAGWQPNTLEQAEFNRLQALQTYLAGHQQEALKQYRVLVNNPATTLSTKREFVSLLLQSRLHDEAQQWTTQLLAQWPNDPIMLYYDARLAYNANRLEAAAAALTEALVHLPETDMLLSDRLQVLELLSTVLTAQGRPAEALEYSRLIRTANPEAFLARQQYKDALAAASIGDLATAKDAFAEILNQFPDNQQAALLLGLINFEEGDLASAEALLSANLNAETAPVTLIQATALAQAEQGKADQALAVLQRALLARPDDLGLLSLYGVICLNNQQEQQGVQALRKALRLDPSKTRLHLLLAQYYVGQARMEPALAQLRTAFAENIQDWSSTGLYLTLLVRQQQTTEIQTVRERIGAEFATDPPAMWLMAVADVQLGNSRSAIALLATLHTRVPNNPNVISALARLHQQNGEPDRAAELWLEAIRVSPTNSGLVQSLVAAKAQSLPVDALPIWLIEQAEARPDIALPLHAAAVELLINQGQLAAAQTLASQYHSSDLPRAHAIRANVLRAEGVAQAEAGDWAGALKTVDRAIALMPNNSQLTLLAAKIDIQLADEPGARKRLQGLIAEQPNNAEALSALAGISMANGASELARSQYQQALAANPDWVPALNNLAWLVRSEDPAQALLYAAAAAELAPRSAAVLDTYGWILHLNGQPAKALQILDAALGIEPENEEIREHRRAVAG